MLGPYFSLRTFLRFIGKIRYILNKLDFHVDISCRKYIYHQNNSRSMTQMVKCLPSMCKTLSSIPPVLKKI
jgi:hypothetical protein